MKTVIEMAHEVYGEHTFWTGPQLERLKQFAELVRADERNSWPAEMEAMERQVNILTDALAESRRGIDAMIALARADERVAMMQLFTDSENQPTQHGTVTLECMQREIAAEREECAKVCEEYETNNDITATWLNIVAEAIRARGQA